MFTFTLSNFFGSQGENWLYINVVISWQLSKQGIGWPVSTDRIAGSGVDSSRSSFFEVIRWQFRWQVTSFQMLAGSSYFFKKFLWNLLCSCHYGPTLLRFWFQTNLGRKNWASYLEIQLGGEDLFLPRKNFEKKLWAVFCLESSVKKSKHGRPT